MGVLAEVAVLGGDERERGSCDGLWHVSSVGRACEGAVKFSPRATRFRGFYGQFRKMANRRRSSRESHHFFTGASLARATVGAHTTKGAR